MLRLFDKEGTDDFTASVCANPACLGEPWCSAWGICQGYGSPLAKEPSSSMEEASLDQECDRIFMELAALHPSPTQFSSSKLRKKTEQHKMRFAPPKTDEEVEAARKASMPKKTREDMEYCMRIWSEWRESRQEITPITSMTKQEIDEAMCRFALEIRRKDGKQYPPNTIHHICCGVMRYLRTQGKPEIDFFKDSSFSHFRAVLDSEMKRLQGQGVGSKRRQAEPITQEEEEVLWKKGMLGQDTGRALVDTMLYMCGTYFALRSGQEHRALRFSPPQIELFGEKAFLRYTEDVSKNNPGGLKGRKNKRKIVTHYQNNENPSRCFVNLYKIYQSKCPQDRPERAFYLQPLANPVGDIIKTINTLLTTNACLPSTHAPMLTFTSTSIELELNITYYHVKPHNTLTALLVHASQIMSRGKCFL